MITTSISSEKLNVQFIAVDNLNGWAHFKKEESEMSDYRSAELAVKKLNEKHQKPFFFMVGFLRPLVPCFVPKKHFDMHDKSKIKLPVYQAEDLNDIPAAGLKTINKGNPRTEWAIKEKQWCNIIHTYMVSITFVDKQLGKVLDALEKNPYSKNTIIVLWSDHGYHMGEKNTFQKHTLRERSAVVPLIIKKPSIKKSSQCSKTVQLVDLFPTLIDLCGLPKTDKSRGRSLKPLLENPKRSWNYPAFTYCKDGGKSVQLSRYRYIEYGDGSKELYYHTEDPHEWKNLAKKAEYAEIIAKFKTTVT